MSLSREQPIVEYHYFGQGNQDLGVDVDFLRGLRGGRDFLPPPGGLPPKRLPAPPGPFFEPTLFMSGTLPSQIY